MRQTEKRNESTELFLQRQQAIIQQLWLVQLVMRRLDKPLPSGMSWDDALHYGYIGLIEAMDRYQEDRSRFITFAYKRIQGAITDGIASFHWMTRSQLRDAQKWKYTKEYLELLEGRPVSDQEICEYLGFTSIRGERWSRLGSVTIVYSDEEDLIPGLEKTRSGTEENCFELLEERLSLQQAIQRLNRFEQRLIKTYYFQNKPLKAFAKENHISCNWAYALHKRVLQKLRKWMSS